MTDATPVEAAAAVDRAMMQRDILELRDDINGVGGKVDALSVEVSELLALFKGAKAVVNAVKWLGGIGAGLAAVWALFHGGVK